MRKKLFAILMSAMMMVTFMPAMAFAATVYADGWADDYSYYMDANEAGTDAEYYYDVFKYVEGTYDSTTHKVAAWNGEIKVGAYDDLGNVISGSLNNNTLGYDLDNSVVTKVKQSWSTKKTKFTAGELNSYFATSDKSSSMVNVGQLTLSVPSYVTMVKSGASWVEASDVVGFNTKDLAETTDYTKGTFKITKPSYSEAKKYEAQDFTLFVSRYYNVTNEKTFFGEVPSRALTVTAAKDPKVGEVTYTLDGEPVANAKYNGSNHKLAQATLKGITSTYQMLNTATGKYEDVTGDVVVKNVGDYHVIALAKDEKGNTKKTYIDFSVTTDADAYVTFKGESFKVAGSFDAKDYLKVASVNTEKAAKADAATILAFFNEAYDVVVENGVATFAPKTLTADEQEALAAKYAELIGNYEYLCGADMEKYQSATFDVIDYIEFTKAPLTKTYKYKNLKKKAKTFTVKAEAASGAKLVYKVNGGAGKIVINKNTGKVTVKKGLKKGTYKVKVSAITVESYNSGAALQVEDHYTLKIKVK